MSTERLVCGCGGEPGGPTFGCCAECMQPEPRFFGHGDPEPPEDVAAVLDELGQVWQRSAGRWRHQFASLPWHLLTSVPGAVFVEVALPRHPDPVRVPPSERPVTG